MCELFTIGATTVTVMEAIGAVGAVMGVMGAIQSGEAQKKAADYNAQVAENDAIAKQQAAAFEEERQRERARRELAFARAQAGGSGTTMSGSPLDIMARSAENAELEALAIRYSGQLGANASRSQAAADRMQGKIAQQAGYMQAGTTLLTAAGKWGDKFFPAKAPTPAPSGNMINTDIGYGPMRIAPRPGF